MLSQATKDLSGAPTAVSLAMLAAMHDEPILAVASTNAFAALKDNDESDGGVQLLNKHLESNSDDDDEPMPLQDLLRTAYAQPSVAYDIA
jgi:hypothetical protein